MITTEKERGPLGAEAIQRLERFEEMLREILRQSEYEQTRMDRLKAEGKEKTATYRQYLANQLLYRRMLDKYREHGLLDR